MAPNVRETTDQQATANDLTNLLGRMNRKITVRTNPSAAAPIAVTRHPGGTFEVMVREGELEPENLDKLTALVISQIESIENVAELKNNPQYAEPVRLYEQRLGNPAYKLFYETVFQTIAIHKGAVHIPILREKLADIGRRAGAALNSNPKNTPLHIQFLLALMGVTQNMDPAVQNAIGDLESAGTLGFIKHIENAPGEKLLRINSDIFPLYEYFLRTDKKQWKKEAKNKPTEKTDKAEKIKDETREKVEEVKNEGEKDDKQKSEEAKPEGEKSEDSEPGKSEQEGEKQEGEKGEGDGEGKPSPGGGDTPDHQKTYRTPEGGTFEKDPNGTGYQLEISPPLRGYYAIDRKDRFNHSALLEWDSTAQYHRYTQTPALIGKQYTIQGELRGGGMKPIPVPNGYALDLSTLKTTGDTPEIIRDENGNFFFRIQKQCTFSIGFSKETKPIINGPTQQDIEPLYQTALSQKAEDATAAAKKKPHSPLEQARIIREYIRKNHKYPPGKNDQERLEAARKTQLSLKKSSTPNDYVINLDTAAHLECFSANTLMAAMMRNLGVPCRMVTGHHVESVNKKGNAVINSGNGHGWCEIWDGRTWVRFDATPPGDPNEKQDEKEKENGDDSEEQSGPSDKADDGGEDTPTGDDGEDGEDGDGEGQEGKGKGKSGDKDGKQKGGKSDSQDGKEGESGEGGEGGEGESFNPEEEFEKMYKQLQDYISQHPDDEQVHDAQEQMESEELDLEPPEPKDPIENLIEKKHPDIPVDERQQMAEFVRGFLRAVEKMKHIKNPNADVDPDHPMLIDALRAIIDRVISRSMIREEAPRYPVADGEVLMDPVSLYFDEMAGLTDSDVWLRHETQEREELRIVKVRRRKILDASGSMGDPEKLETQQLIETLENIVTAEKQQELEVLSRSLNRDLCLETESWQFGVYGDPEFGGFRRLKKLSPQFDVVEQALTWYAASEAVGGTNDYDPLEEIYKEIMDEETTDKQERPDQPSTLDRIKTGFCIRELKNLEELEGKDDKSLTPGEKIYLQNLRANKLVFETFMDTIRAHFPDIEPIIEVIEVTSDGGSNSPARVQEIIQKLRSIGAIVVAYGLGSDGKAVEITYANPYNPLEGGFHCVNLLDYPRRKLSAWSRILDKV